MAATLNKPYVWLEFISTSSSILHFTVLLPEGIDIPTSLPEPDDDFTIRRRTITYVTSGEDEGGTPHPEERDYPLDESTDYDPVLDDIIVEIVEGGTLDRKGQGSVHHAEGDTSGGD